MVPWSDALLKESSAADFLQAQFVALYGSEARDWVIACDDAPYGQPRLACGIERGLLETFRQLMGEHRHTCQFVEPVISAAWRKITQNLGNQVKAFALIEVGMIVLASVNRGRIVAVQTQPCGKSWQDELMKAWQRWTLRLPELAETAEVVVLNLTSEIMNGELPPPFKHVTISLSGLEPAYTFAACSRSR